MAYSKAKLKSSGDRASPCFRPFLIGNLSLINVNNDNSAEIKKRILMANKGFYGLKRQFRSQYLSIKYKIKLYKTLTRPTLAYGSETWVLSKCDEAILGDFERKILRANFGLKNDNGEWRIKYNNGFIHCTRKGI